MKIQIGDEIILSDGQCGVIQDYKNGDYLVRTTNLITIDGKDVIKLEVNDDEDKKE